MKKSTVMRQIEARFLGRDIREIVPAVRSRHATPEGAANELGISRKCLENWERAFAEAEREPAGVA